MLNEINEMLEEIKEAEELYDTLCAEEERSFVSEHVHSDEYGSYYCCQY